MIVEKVVNIFKKEEFANRFKTINTEFEVQKGKISSIISETEYEELNNEKQTLYQKTTKVEQTADKINWIVEGESKTEFTLTDQAAELMTKSLVIKSPDGKEIIISDGTMNIDRIFAQDIKATGCIEGLDLKGATGSFSGDVTAESFSIQKSVISIQDKDIQQSCFDMDTDTVPGTITAYNFIEKMKAFSMDTDCIIDAPKGISTSKVFADELRATNYVSGRYGVFNYISAYNMYISIADAQGKYDVVAIKDFIQSMNEKNQDSGWIYPDISSGFFAAYSTDSNQVRYRKVGKVVLIQGICTLKSDVTIEGGIAESTIFTLAEGYRPSSTLHILSQGSGTNKWLLSVRTDGSVTFSRYSNGSGWVNATGKVWLPFSATFAIG